MPKAEAGSTKDLSNRMKLKGLQRLRWYCQVCEKQCRDANGFKMHSQSESHVRQMLVVGEDPKKFIQQYSDEFLKDFIQLLKTGHGEKQVQLNRFYQEYIANKEHIHMNATKWPSLTEFAKHLGREGICRVEESEKDGIMVSWIDNSPDALRRTEALKRKQAQDQGDDEREQRAIREQIRRAQESAAAQAKEPEDLESRELKREEGQKIKLAFGAKSATAPKPESQAAETPQGSTKEEEKATAADESSASKPKPLAGFSMKPSGKPQTKNVFAQAKKNTLSTGPKKAPAFGQPAKISEAERIMKEEMEKKKRPQGSMGFNMPSGKRFKGA